MKIITRDKQSILCLTAKEKARELGITHYYLSRIVNHGVIAQGAIITLPNRKQFGRPITMYKAMSVADCTHSKKHSIFTIDGERIYCNWCMKLLN